MIPRFGTRGIFWGCRKYPSCKGTKDAPKGSAEESYARMNLRLKDAGVMLEDEGLLGELALKSACMKAFREGKLVERERWVEAARMGRVVILGERSEFWHERR